MNKADNISAFAIFIFSFMFYFFTLAPTILWGDSAKLALYVYNFYLPFDLIGGHPLHTIAGKLFSFMPINDFACRQNLMSAFFGSASLVILYFLMRQIGIKGVSSALATLAFAVSHTFWLTSVINESYAISIFFISTMLLILTLFCRLESKVSLICLCSFLFGLSLTNNLISVFLLPGILYIFLLKENRALIFKYAVFWIPSFICGISLWIYIYFKNYKSPFSIDFVNNFLAMTAWYSRPQNFLKELIKYPAYLFYQFPFLGFFIGLIGIKSLFHNSKKFLCASLIIIISYILFSSGYMMQRKFFILIPSYLIFSIYVGAGLDYIFAKSKNRYLNISLSLFLILVSAAIYYVTPKILAKLDKAVINIRTLPYRDNLSFYFWPNKRNEHGAKKYAEEVLKSAKFNSIILADFTPGMVLKYLQELEGFRKDVVIEDVDRFVFLNNTKGIIEYIDAHIKDHPIYLADSQPYYEIASIQKKYNVIKQGVFYEVQKR